MKPNAMLKSKLLNENVIELMKAYALLNKVGDLLVPLFDKLRANGDPDGLAACSPALEGLFGLIYDCLDVLQQNTGRLIEMDAEIERLKN